MDESWVYSYDPETKEQSREWLCSMEARPQKPRRTIGTAKVMLVSFFDSKGMIYREFVRRPVTINQIMFYQIFTHFDIAFQNRRGPRGQVRGHMFIHMDNASAHTARLTGQHIRNLGWTALPHPAYSPDLAPSDFWIFPRLKKGLRGCRFATITDLEQAVDEEIGSIGSEYKDCMLVKWPACWRKCATLQGNYFEGIH